MKIYFLGMNILFCAKRSVSKVFLPPTPMLQDLP